MSLRVTSYSVVSRTMGVAVLMLVIGPAAAAAQVLHHPVSVDIKSVLAADTNQGFDSRLGTMTRPLKMLFHYSTYRLLSHEEKKTECGRMLFFSLPGGRILHVEPRGIDGNMIELEVVLFQGEKPMMATDFHMMNRGTLLLGGPRYKEGMLIISIGAAAPLPPSAHRQLPSNPHHHLSAASPHPDLDIDN
jgi:hypothetical protein